MPGKGFALGSVLSQKEFVINNTVWFQLLIVLCPLCLIPHCEVRFNYIFSTFGPLASCFCQVDCDFCLHLEYVFLSYPVHPIKHALGFLQPNLCHVSTKLHSQHWTGITC